MSWQWSVPGIRSEFLYKKFKELMDSGATDATGIDFLIKHLNKEHTALKPRVKEYWDAYYSETKETR